MSRVGALSECPFQGDESIHSAGKGTSVPADEHGGLTGSPMLWHMEVRGDSTVRRGVLLPLPVLHPQAGGNSCAVQALTGSDRAR